MVSKPRPAGQHLPRWIFLRLLALTHLAAFGSFWIQAHGLVGSQGVLPAEARLARARALDLSFFELPGLHWLGASDLSLHLISAAGITAALGLLVGLAPRILLGLLWLLALTVFHVGGPFLSFQWDILLIEASLLAIPYAPAGLWPRLRAAPPPGALATWLLRLLLFKLILSSGVVKLNAGDPTWHGLTALSFHFWTQPLPHGAAWYAHQLPDGLLRFATGATLVIELLAPILILVNPRRWRLAVFLGASLLVALFSDGVLGPASWLGLAALGLLLDDRILSRIAPALVPEPAPGGGARWPAALAIAGLMLLISATGNYGFFQLLTLALCLPLLDDGLFWELTPARAIPRWPPLPERPDGLGRGLGLLLGLAWLPLSALIMLGLARPQAAAEPTLLHRLARQAEAWRDPALAAVRPFVSVNGYGLFARMTTHRFELEIQGSADGQTWRSYRLPYQPQGPQRAPPLVGVHMPRLDWLMWFAALQPRCTAQGWPLALLRGLLEGRAGVRSLFAEDPFLDAPPRWIRVQRAHYRFTDRAQRETTGDTWIIEPAEPWCPPLDRAALGP